MEDDLSFQDKVFEFGKKNWLILALLFGGLIFIGIGIVQMTGVKTASVKFEKGAVLGSESQESMGTEIKVDVEGQVVKPGVYSLMRDARVQDALIAAGGLSAAANRNALNLAQKISDGQKIYVPAVGEAAAVSGGMGSLVSGGDTGGENSSGLVSINSASQSELESLPGIGPVSAGKIIDGRPYGSLDELLSKKVVGKATYEKIKDLITL